jgi:Holliday junction DNA helicase RuvA
MISYLRGKILIKKEDFLILEVNNVGYKVFVTGHVVKIINDDKRKDIDLFIHEHIREDSDSLYGFSTYPELELFEKLISVSGVGLKVGLIIMNMSDTGRIINAIINEDVTFFTAISGVGKKVAAKIILELKTKLNSDQATNIIGKMNESNDLIFALENLGYKRNEVQELIVKIPANLVSFENKIRWCLQHMNSN